MLFGGRETFHVGLVIEGLRKIVKFEHIAVPEYGMIQIERIRWHDPRVSMGYSKKHRRGCESGIPDFHTGFTWNANLLKS